MTTQNLTLTLSVPETPDVVFAAITNVRGWWSGQIDGDTDRLGAEFTYQYKDVHVSRQRVTEFVPGRRLAWRVIDSRLSRLTHQHEWTGTTIAFDIARRGDRTDLTFTHVGLTPDTECYGSCSNGWTQLITGNLRDLIASGETQPDVFASRRMATR